MRLSELLMQTVVAFLQGRIGNCTMIELGASEFKVGIIFARYRYEPILEGMNKTKS